jgi:hypothetical protein
MKRYPNSSLHLSQPVLNIKDQTPLLNTSPMPENGLPFVRKDYLLQRMTNI